MTYQSHDESVQNGLPVHLFLFVNDDVTYRLTDLAKPVVALGETWEPSGIIQGTITQSRELNRDILSLRLPVDHPIASVFTEGVQDSITSVTVFRGYRDDPDEEFVTYWKGRVSTPKIEQNTISLDCEPITTSLRRPGLRARYTRNCRHALYGRGCLVDKDSSSFAVVDTITAVADLVITVPAASLEVDGEYTGGLLRLSGGDYRFIKGHVGSLLTLNKPHAALQIGESVTVHPGCDRTTTRCVDRFNNLDNYGGFPYIPTVNPFGGGSLV